MMVHLVTPRAWPSATWLRPRRLRSAFSRAGDEFIAPRLLTGVILPTILRAERTVKDKADDLQLNPNTRDNKNGLSGPQVPAGKERLYPHTRGRGTGTVRPAIRAAGADTQVHQRPRRETCLRNHRHPAGETVSGPLPVAQAPRARQ